MAQVSGIEIAISADSSGLDKGLNRAQGAISRFSKSAVAGLAGALSAGVFVAAGKAAIDFADAVGKTAQKVGSTTKALSELNYAAGLSDLTFSDLETGMRFLSKSMVNNADLFNQLGVAIQNSDGSLRSTDQVLMDLAGTFASIPDGAQKTALAMELLGRSGASMIPMLNAGSSGLEKMRQRAIDLGLSISEDTAKRAEQFNDTITDLAAVGQGAMMRLASATLPLAQAFLNVSVAGTEAMVGLGGAIQEIAPYAAIAAAGVAGFYAPAILAGLATTATGIFSLSAAIKAVTLAMMANPLGLLIGGIAAATVAIFAFRDDIKSAIGVDIPSIAKDAINFVIRGFMNLKDVIKITYENLGNIVGAALVGMSNAVLSAITELSNKVIDGLNYVLSFANKIPGVTIGAFEKLKGYQFENVFADGAAQAGRDIGNAMAENAVTDYVGKIGELASGAMSKVSQLFSGGAIAAGGGGDGIIPAIPGAGGGDKGEDGATSIVPGVAPSQEVDAMFMSRLESIREGFMSERELLEAEYATDMELLRSHLTGKDDIDAEFKDLMRQRAEQHARDMNEIQRAQVQEDLQEVSTGLGSLQSAFQSGNKKMLKAAKIFGVARAVVDTLVAATAAMKTGLTPAQMFANYAAVFAKGMSAVAAIKGVSEGGGGSGGGGGGGSRGGGEGGAAPAAASPTTTFQFTMMNDPMGFGEKFARQFIDQLNSTQRNGGTIRGVIA